MPLSQHLFIPDGEPHVFNDKLYLYGSKDVENGIVGNEQTWCSTSYSVVSTSDLMAWEEEKNAFRVEDFPAEIKPEGATRLWAPDVCCHPINKKYYLFSCTNKGGIFVSESEQPTGPFINIKKVTLGGEPIFQKTIDPGVFVDDDDSIYLVWPGANMHPWSIGQLSPDDLSLVIPETVRPIDGLIEPYEGPSLRKRGNIYYYIYIKNDGPWADYNNSPTVMAYMTSPHPLGPYTYQGKIIESSSYGGGKKNIHGSIVEWKGEWYVFYHLPLQGYKFTRMACARKISFNHDGTIPQVLLNSCGPFDAFEINDVVPATSAVFFSGGTHCQMCDFSNFEMPYLYFKKQDEYVGYRYVNFGNGECQSILLTGQFPVDATLEMRADEPDGQLLGTFLITGSSKNQSLSTTPVSYLSHRHSIYLKVIYLSGNISIKVFDFVFRCGSIINYNQEKK